MAPKQCPVTVITFSSTGAATGRIVLLGATSIIGYNLARLYPETVIPVCTSRSRHPAVAGWPRLRLECEREIGVFLQEWKPRTVIYCDAVCDVEKCETNPDWAREINVGNLRRFLTVLDTNVRLVVVSSDHVFGGDGVYDESSEPCPISVYGRSRVEAEQVAAQRPGTLIVRPGLPVGPSMDGRTGHRDWLKYRTTNGLPITIVHDEARSTVRVEDIAARLLALAGSRVTGYRHLAATRASYRPELARHLLEKMHLPEIFTAQSRHDQRTPHLGHVELATRYNDELAGLLPTYVDMDEAALEKVR